MPVPQCLYQEKFPRMEDLLYNELAQNLALFLNVLSELHHI